MKLQKANLHWHEDKIGPGYSKCHPSMDPEVLVWPGIILEMQNLRYRPRPKEYKSAFLQDL